MTKFKKFFTAFFPKFLIFTGISILIATYSQYAISEIKYYYDYLTGKKYSLAVSRNTPIERQGFTNLADSNSIKIVPKNTDFGIVIERLAINAPIVRDVSVVNPNDYLEALKKGVAHASFSGYPSSDNANVYLFAHSSNSFWQLGEYANVFNGLAKLNIKDQVNIFFEGKRYVYEVDNKLLVNDFKVDETIYESLGPTLTLQTCYPAGTTLYRLIIRASLVGVFDYNN
jgi:LPXTG-site transpeptidase (sortase) family protein